MSLGSIQGRIELQSIINGIARFGSGAREHHVAVLDVSGADSPLGSADDAAQEAILAGRTQFLNAQLDKIAALDPKIVVAGHKRTGSPDLPENLAASQQCLRDFSRIAGQGAPSRISSVG